MPRKNNAVFSFVSEERACIGDGRSECYNITDASITVKVVDTHAVEFSIRRDQDSWSLELAAPINKRLRVGKYMNAVRYGVDRGGPDIPELSMWGNGKGHNRSTGEFTINRIRFSKKGLLVHLDAEFMQRGTEEWPKEKWPEIPVVRGKIYYYRKPTDTATTLATA